jgi:hypothetical protein
MMAQLDARSVERNGARFADDLFDATGRNVVELGITIDETCNQPGSGYAIYMHVVNE